MKMLPKTVDSPVIRTDFEHQHAWETICGRISAPVVHGKSEFRAYVEFVEESDFCGLTPEELLARTPDGFGHSFLLVVDSTTTQDPEFPVLVIDLVDDRGRTFRSIPSEIWGIENNLSIANMDFYDFAENVDEDGVFRGFPSL